MNTKRTILTQQETPIPIGLGLDSRLRPRTYKEIIGIPRSIYYQTNNITTTERSMGMPTGSAQDIYTRITGTSGSALQISSSNVNDIAAGSGALTIYIEGIYITSAGDWMNRSTLSTPTTMDGQDAVQIGTETNWYRINKIWVLTTGSNDKNVGDLYISPLGQALTAGVPDANTLASIIVGFNNSSGGFFSVASNQRFNYTKGNFWVATNKEIRFREHFYQSLVGSSNTADMNYYEVGEYVGASASYDYIGAAPYTGLTDIGMNVYTTVSTANSATYYVEYVLADDNKTMI